MFTDHSEVFFIDHSCEYDPRYPNLDMGLPFVYANAHLLYFIGNLEDANSPLDTNGVSWASLYLVEDYAYRSIVCGAQDLVSMDCE